MVNVRVADVGPREQLNAGPGRADLTVPLSAEQYATGQVCCHGAVFVAVI